MTAIAVRDRILARARRWWPFVSRRRYEALRQENYTLRDALREANGELRRHRVLIAGLRDGDAAMTAAVQKAIT